jgi:hypothetical protein
MLPRRHSPVQSAWSLHSKAHVEPPLLQSMSHSALPVHAIAQMTPWAQSIAQSLSSEHSSEQGDFVHTKRHVSLPLQVHDGPHSPLVAVPVSVLPASLGAPASAPGVPDDPELPDVPEVPPSALSVPMLKSYEQPTASRTTVTNAMVQARRITLRA